MFTTHHEVYAGSAETLESDQLKLIEASKKAGTIKRFFPSEFGGDYTPSGADGLSFNPALRQYLQAKEVVPRPSPLQARSGLDLSHSITEETIHMPPAAAIGPGYLSDIRLWPSAPLLSFFSTFIQISLRRVCTEQFLKPF